MGWSLVDAVGVQVDPQVPAWLAPWGTLPAPVLAHGPRGPNTEPTTRWTQGSQGERTSSMSQTPCLLPRALYHNLTFQTTVGPTLSFVHCLVPSPGHLLTHNLKLTPKLTLTLES